MVAPTSKKHQRSAALRKRIGKMRIQLQELEDMYAASIAASSLEPAPAAPPSADEDPEEEEPRSMQT